MTNLPVPYKSQWDQDALSSHNNCGPTCIAMILGFYDVATTTDAVHTKTGADGGLVTISQLQTAISSYGCKSTVYVGTTPDQLKTLLDSGQPVMALVHAGSLTSRQDQGFTGGHFVVVVGYREDGYFVNDPDFWDKFRGDGDHHFYTTQDFEKALFTTPPLDGNTVGSIIVIAKPDVSSQVDVNSDIPTLRHDRDENYNLFVAVINSLGVYVTPGNTKEQAAQQAIQAIQNTQQRLQDALTKVEAINPPVTTDQIVPTNPGASDALSQQANQQSSNILFQDVDVALTRLKALFSRKGGDK